MLTTMIVNRTTETDVRIYIYSGLCSVVEYGEKVVVMFSVGVHREPPCYKVAHTKRTAEVRTCAVVHAEYGNGVGARARTATEQGAPT